LKRFAPPLPLFFVSVADKGLTCSANSLESILTDFFVSVASKWVTGAVYLQESNGRMADGFDEARRTAWREGIVAELARITLIQRNYYNTCLWRIYTTVEGLPSLEVNCLFEDSSGTLWSGTSAGLAFFASNRFQIPHESPDVLRKQIVGMAEDKRGRFWIATSDHVLRVAREKLLSGVVQGADVREYGHADGLESTEGVKRSRLIFHIFELCPFGPNRSCFSRGCPGVEAYTSVLHDSFNRPHPPSGSLTN